MPFAVPWAVILIGNAVDDPTVLILNSGPVRVLPVVSMKLKIATVEVPESAAAVNSQSFVDGDACVVQVKAVLSPAGIVIDNPAVGAIRDDQRGLPPATAGAEYS